MLEHLGGNLCLTPMALLKPKHWCIQSPTTVGWLGVVSRMPRRLRRLRFTSQNNPQSSTFSRPGNGKPGS